MEQTRFALQVRDRLTEANDAVRTIRNTKWQLDDRKAKMSGTPSFATMAATFADSLSAAEDSIYQTKNQSGEDPLNFPVRVNNQLAALMGFIGSGDRRPPPQAYEVWNTLSPKLGTQLTRLKLIMDTQLPKINAALEAAGLPEIVPSTAEPPPSRTTAMDDDIDPR